MPAAAKHSDAEAHRPGPYHGYPVRPGLLQPALLHLLLSLVNASPTVGGLSYAPAGTPCVSTLRAFGASLSARHLARQAASALSAPEKLKC